MEKVQLLKSPKIKGRLTKREKNLLIILLLVIVIYAVYTFIINPQLNKLQSLNEQKSALETRISQINSIIGSEKDIEERLSKLRDKKENLESRFFASLSQSQLISLLEEMTRDDGFVAEDMVFYDKQEEQIGDMSFVRMDVDIPYRGTYEGVLRVLKGISSYPKKIIVTSLIMDSTGDELAGTLSLSFYSMDGRDDSKGTISIPEAVDEFKEDPFLPFDEYEADMDDIIEKEIKEDITEPIGELEEGITDNYYREILEDFEEGNFDFIPSNRYVQGNVFRSATSKSNRNSVRLEYSILAIEDENRAYIDLSDRKTSIKYPPSSIGLWIYSYGYSPSTIGLKLIGQNNEEYYLPISEGISWIGWNYVETVPPLDVSLYPLKIDKLYLELTNYRDDFGVLLFDKLEANYPVDSNNSGQSFLFHMVKQGETLDDISMKYYGTKEKKGLIKQYNEITSDNIQPGRILVIPRQEE